VSPASQPPASAGPEILEVIPARQGDHEYPVRVGRGAGELAAGLAAEHDRAVLVTCANVLRTGHGKEVRRELERGGNLAHVHVLPDGEAGKTLAELEKAAGALLRAGATRRSVVISLGGGAVSDAAGFLAASFMRGIPWVAVPTTLLSMVDAAIGGKTGVNLPVAKNAVGAFHPPEAVLADPATLATLPARERASGTGEVMKYGALDPSLLDTFVERCRAGLPDPAVIAACARMKVDVVEADPREQGPRKLLNLGHTFGHGVEAAGRFSRFTHGEAVAVGLAFAFRLARQLGRVGDAEVAKVEAALAAVGLPTRVPPAIARAGLKLMAFDKKRSERGLLFVLPAAAESGWRVEWDVPAPEQAIRAAADEVSARPAARRSARPVVKAKKGRARR
jgi:3-dehydroquinate synthetase